MKQIKVTLPVKKPRNPMATHPLMHKGGCHGTTTKTKRRNTKQRFKADIQRGVFEKVVNDYFLKHITYRLSAQNAGVTQLAE